MQRPAATAAELRTAKDEQAFWEQMAAATEANEAALRERLAAAQATTPPKALGEVATYVAAASAAVKYVELDEAETRKLVDEQLRQAGWEADSTSASTMRWRRSWRSARGACRSASG